MILRFLFLMTFFFARQAFFHHFLLKFNYWGGMEVKYLGMYPPGICSPIIIIGLYIAVYSTPTIYSNIVQVKCNIV